MLEIHCLMWTGTNTIHKYGCYTSLARAERHMKAANKTLRFWHRLGGHRWVIKTLKVTEGEVE